MGAAKTLLFGLVPLAVLVVATETAFRLFPPQAPYQTQEGFVVAHPERIWTLAPRSDGPLATNQLGLRDTRYRADARHKVLLLGDSVAWGDGVADVERVFPQRLERELAALDVEVINASVPGYSTFQQAAYLRSDGLALRPDLVVLQFCLNDIVERYTTLAGYGGVDRFLGVDTRHAIGGLHGAVLRNSAVYGGIFRAAQGGARRLEVYRVRNLTGGPLSPELEAAWTDTLAELDGLASQVEEAGLALLLVIAPYRFQLEDPTATRSPQDRLVAWAKGRGITTIDLLAEFAARGGTPMHDDTHFSVEGHEVAARVLAGPVRAALGGAQ